MRLTDRPRTLEEVATHVPWPAELQQVLDRALARDRASRYQTARDFARDLTRTVAAMPGAAALGDSRAAAWGAPEVPPVVGAAPAAAPLATAEILPPTRVRGGQSPPAPAEPTSARGRRRALLPLGIGGAVVATGLAAWLVAGAVGRDPPVDSAAGSPVDTAAAPPASDPREVLRPSDLPRDPSLAPPTKEPGDNLRPRRGQSSAPPSSTASPPPNLDSILEVAKDEVFEQKRPDSAVVRIRAVLPLLRTRADSVKAYYGLAEALIATETSAATEEGCSILRGIRNDPGNLRAGVARLLDVICQD
jgi:hypothetical protein